MIKSTDLSQSKDPVLRGSMDALRRAATLARRTAVQTGTALVVMEGGRLIRIPADELREQETQPAKPS